MPTFWISKYALNKGIYQAECDEPPKSDPGFLVNRSERAWHYFSGEGREWHRTEADAIAKAEDMRTRKIDSLRKQIDRLEKLTFKKES